MAGPGNADSLWRGCVHAGILGSGPGSVPVYQGPGSGQAARKKVNRMEAVRNQSIRMRDNKWRVSRRSEK